MSQRCFKVQPYSNCKKSERPWKRRSRSSTIWFKIEGLPCLVATKIDSTILLRRRSQSFTMTSCVPLTPALCLPSCCWIQRRIRHRWSRHTVGGSNRTIRCREPWTWLVPFLSHRTRADFHNSKRQLGSFTLTCSVPQGSEIGPKEFIMYTEDIEETIDRFIVNHHLYADDSQLLAHMKINAVKEHRRRLETCVESLRDWCSSRRLQLNPDKTELIRFGSRANLVKLRQLDVMSIHLCSVAVEPLDSVRDLGVILDSELSMRVHISKISSTWLFHLRRLRKLCPLIDTASAHVSRWLSYCRGLTTVTPCSRVYLPAHLHHCSEF